MARKCKPVAHCLSRVQVSSVHLGMDYSAIAADQLKEIEVQGFRKAETVLHLEHIPYQDSAVNLLCNVSLGRPRSSVPTCLCSQVNRNQKDFIAMLVNRFTKLGNCCGT